MDGALLQGVETLDSAPAAAGAGQMWELLQAEKERVEQDILSESRLRENGASSIEYEPAEEGAREIEWRHRETLEHRLRAINDAQDRLIDGGYGTCLECGEQIGTKRLCANPATLLCIDCQTRAEESRQRLF